MASARGLSLLQRLTLLLVAVAFVIKMMVPAGFMLGSALHSSTLTAITLCTSSGPTTVWMDEKGAITDPKGSTPAPTKEKNGSHNQPCSVGCHASVLHQLTGFTLSSSAIAYVIVNFVVVKHFAVPGQGLAAPPPPSQGPPQ
jgi:hypothetical protein